MLYGASSWTLLLDMQHRIQRTQRKMLRMILGSGRRIVETSDNVESSSSNASEPSSENGLGPPRESWVAWVKRTTHTAESLLGRSNDWCTSWKRRTWQFAYRVATADSRRWTWRVSRWAPGNEAAARRAPHGPKKRWTDDIIRFLKGNDIDAANDNLFSVVSSFTNDQWELLGHKFCGDTSI